MIGREDGKRIVLDGPAPRRDPKGCAVLGYYANSPHAHLVLKYSAHHH